MADLKPFDVEKETPITLSEARALPFLKSRKPGTRVDITTLRRWVIEGKLEAVRIGGSIMTSRQAVTRFIYGKNVAPIVSSPINRFRITTPAETSRALDAAGI